jgi:hypothetical protein
MAALIGKWMRKAYESSLAGATIICHRSRTNRYATWWHDYAVKGEVEFIRGRLKFEAARQIARRFPPRWSSSARTHSLAVAA